MNLSRKSRRIQLSKALSGANDESLPEKEKDPPFGEPTKDER
jgi:hypothetical protein